MVKHIVLKLLLCVIVLYPITGSAQIKGTVKDTTNQPIPFANVLLLQPQDSTIVNGLMASENGGFNFDNVHEGTFIIGVSALGYKKYYSNPVQVKNSNTAIRIDSIQLEVKSHELEEIRAVAQKPIYEMKMDRMVVNLESSITSTGTTALETLEKSPGVIVDYQNNTLSLMGKSGVKLMINGKLMRIPSDATFQMLRSMNSDNIQTIELITTPPAKYDAEGNAGIINIILKKNKNFGTNGTFSIGGGMGRREKLPGNISLNYRREKVNYFGNYGIFYDNGYYVIQSKRYFNSFDSVFSANSESVITPKELSHSIQLGLDYFLSENTTIGVLFSGNFSYKDFKSVNTVSRKSNQLQTSLSKLYLKSNDSWSHGFGNVNLVHKFNENNDLDINFDYLFQQNENDAIYEIENIQGENEFDFGEQINSEKSTPLNIYVGKIDYSSKVNSHFSIETGIKATVSRFHNDLAVSYLKNRIWKIDDELTNKFKLNEEIIAGYVSAKYQFSKKTVISGGLRYEYLNSVLTSQKGYNLLDLHYGKFFPTVYFSKVLNKNNSLQLSYDRRIDRPTFNQLAPFVYFLSPDSYVSGNEELLPAFSNSYSLSYKFKNYILTLSVTNTKDAILRNQPEFNEDRSKQYFVSKNFDQQNTAYAMLFIPKQVTNWWNMKNYIYWYKQQLKTNFEGEYLDLSDHYIRFYSQHSLKIRQNIFGEISGFYLSKKLSGIYTAKPLGRLDIGLKVESKNKQNVLSFNFRDVFKTSVYRSSANIPALNIHTSWNLDWEPRRFMLTYTRHFGNKNVKRSRTRKTGSEEERDRIQNGIF